MWISDIISSKRWFFISLLITLLVPGAVLATLSFYAEDMSQEEALEVAAVAVKNYIDENPPRQGWQATKVYVSQDMNLMVDVHVPRFDHAEVIRTRSERIKYSYLKLACPPDGAWVYEWMTGDNRIWINLHHHGNSLLAAPCPNNQSKGFFNS
mgnify:FL=1|jgi:hypothetical protein